jgi:hypothetical protein
MQAQQAIDRFTRLIVLIVGVLSLCLAAQAQQTTGDIVGTVTDQSGAIIQGATVTAVNIATQEKRNATSTSSGDYVFNLLKPGTYEVTFTFTGFKSMTVNAVQLATGDRVRVNAQLEVGNSTSTVTVTTEASALQTDSSNLASNISESSVQDLPLNGRNFVQLVQLIPGGSEGPSASLTNGSGPDDRRQSASVSVNSQNEVLNNEMIDGADNNERLIGTIAVRPSIDAIAEINIQTNAYTAEVGRTGGGIINVITKSGTNKFHGDVFEFVRNDMFNSNTFNFGNSSLPKAELRWNQYGGSLGGPLLRDKTFFFGSYEGYRQIQGTAPSEYVVPSLYEKQHPGDFSDVGGPVITTMDTAGLAYFKLYPAPTTTINGSPTFVGGWRNSQYSSVYDARIDHALNPNNLIYGRFIYNSVATNAPGPFPDAKFAGVTVNPNFIGTAKFAAQDTDYDVLLNYTHTFTSNLLFEGKAAYTRVNNQNSLANEGLNPNEALGQPNMNTPIGDTTGLAPVIVVMGSNLGDDAIVPIKDLDNTFQYLGNVTYTRGKHNFKAGGTLVRRQLTSFQSLEPQGAWVFLNYPTLLQGQFLSGGNRQLTLAPPHLRVWESAGYVQDDWHIAKGLTLNLGVRYGIFTPFTEVNNRISTWDPATSSLLIAGQNGVSDTAGIKTDYHGLAPRFGFAWDAGHKLVVRGGFGIGYLPMNTTSEANLKDPPFVASLPSCNTPGWGGDPCPSGYQTFAQGLPSIVPTTMSSPSVSIPNAVSPHFRTSYIEQFNLTVQKQIGESTLSASYVGLLGRQLDQLLPDLNAPAPNGCAASPNPTCYQILRPYYSKYPNLGTIGFFQTGGKSSYNSLQTSVERHLAHGLAISANYSWSHSLDNATGLSFEGSNGYGIVPSRVSVLDYGNSSLDLHHRIAGNVSYQLPFGAGASGIKRAIVHGWQTNVIGVWSTGAPFTVLNGSNVSGTVTGTDDRPNQVGKWSVSKPTVEKYFNTSAFQTQTAGTLGSERINQLFGPHWRHMDFSLFKIFPVREKTTLELRAEAFNLTNTANFSTPNSTVGSPQFGQITSMTYNYTPRALQFAAKLQF